MLEGIVRGAQAGDLPGVLELYRDLQPEDAPFPPAGGAAGRRAGHGTAWPSTLSWNRKYGGMQAPSPELVLAHT